MKYKLILLTLILFAIDLSYSTDINYIEKITPKGTYLNLANNLYVSSSNVGIGTTSPSYKLHVNGNFYANTVNTGIGNTEVYLMNQNVRTTDSPTFTRLTLSQGTGTAPLTVSSTTLVTNLNADLLDGYDSSYFQTALTNPVTGTGNANYITKWTGTTSLGNSVIYESGGNVGIGTININKGLPIPSGSLRISGIALGTPMPPNLIRNSYMNVVENGKPVGFEPQISGASTTMTLTAAHPYERCFEGSYTSDVPTGGYNCSTDSLAEANCNSATADSPCWFGRYWKGPRIGRGGLAGGWGSLSDGHILKISGTTDAPGVSGWSSVKIPVEKNVLSHKLFFQAWVKIVEGDEICFGSDAGYNHQCRGIVVSKAEADSAKDGWYKITGILSYSHTTNLETNSFLIGVEVSGGGDYEVYVALPYAAVINENELSTNIWTGSSWLPSVSDMLGREGLYVRPDNGNVGIGTTSPSYKLHVNGNFYANTVNTGIGNTEVYLMNQNVRTTDSPTFSNVYIADNMIHSGDTNTYIGFPAADTIRMVTAGTERVRILSNGNVGIGTTSPSYKLHVNGNFYANTVNTGIGNTEVYLMNQNVRTTDAVTFATVNTGSGDMKLGDASITDGDTNSIPTNDQVYDFVTAYVGSGGSGDIYVNEAGDTMTGNLDMNGNKIINVNKLHATSMGIADTTTNAEANIPAGYSLYVQNDIKIGGNLKGYGADLAENFYFKGDLEPGDVVIITHYQGVEKSTKPYDTRVAGIVSTNPAQIMAIGREGVPVALAGSTPVKVTNESGEIHFGDLLTSSSKPGYAMKCPDKCEGAIIGKALEEFNQSEGMISVLVLLS